MNKNYEEKITEDPICNYLKDNSELIFLEYYAIKKDSIEFKMDKESKETRSDLIYLKMANTWGTSSHCKRMKVGCLVVKDKSIISDGYNGSPSGFPNVCESEEMITLPSIGATMYVTLSPCFECAKLIIQSGIKRIVFCDVYRNTDPLIFLSEGGIEITRISSKYLFDI